MPIAFSQSTTEAHWTGVGVTSETVPFTGASGDTLLLVTVGTNQAQNVTGMTYDGNAMTLVSSLSPGGNNKQWLYAYGGAIAAVSKDIIISFSASIGYFNVAAITLSGSKTDVAGLNVGTNFSNSISTSASSSITTAENNSFVIDSFCHGSDGGVISSTWSSTNGASVRSGLSSQLWYKSVPTAAAQTPSYGMTAGQNWSLISVEIEAPLSTINLTETATNTDSVSRVGSFVRTLTEPGTFTPSVSASRVLPRALVESITLTDSTSITSAFVRSLTDTANVSDLTLSLSLLWTPRVKPTSVWTDRTKPPTTWS